jgi:hypothetical protein
VPALVAADIERAAGLAVWWFASKMTLLTAALTSLAVAFLAHAAQPAPSPAFARQRNPRR